MLEVINSVFIPTFIKTMAYVCGAGSGILVLAFLASIMIMLLYPITKRMN